VKCVGHQTYLHATPDKCIKLVDNFHGAWEAFVQVPGKAGDFALKSVAHGTFLQATPDGKLSLVEDFKGAWESFHHEPSGALKSAHGTFLHASKGPPRAGGHAMQAILPICHGQVLADKPGHSNVSGICCHNSWGDSYSQVQVPSVDLYDHFRRGYLLWMFDVKKSEGGKSGYSCVNPMRARLG